MVEMMLAVRDCPLKPAILLCAGFLTRVLSNPMLVAKLTAAEAGSPIFESVLLLADEVGLDRRALEVLLQDCGSACTAAVTALQGKLCR